MKNQRGFTLLEILIAITILAILMAFTAQTVIRSSRTKVRLQGEIDRDARLTNALRVLERDINLAFHHRQITTEIEKEVKKSAGGDQSQQNPNGPGAKRGGPNAPITNPDGSPAQPATSGQQGFDFEVHDYPQLTHFMGTENSIHFTSLSHVRTIKDSKESDQQEVGYYIENCPDREEPPEGEGETGKLCLWRRATPYIDEDVTKGGGAVLLLTGVKELKFRYYGEDKLDWVSAWRTDEGGDDATKNKFPLAVEISLGVLEKGKESSVSTVIPVLFPNNVKKENSPNIPQPPQGPAQPPTQGGTT